MEIGFHEYICNRSRTAAVSTRACYTILREHADIAPMSTASSFACPRCQQHLVMVLVAPPPPPGAAPWPRRPPAMPVFPAASPPPQSPPPPPVDVIMSTVAVEQQFAEPIPAGPVRAIAKVLELGGQLQGPPDVEPGSDQWSIRIGAPPGDPLVRILRNSVNVWKMFAKHIRLDRTLAKFGHDRNWPQLVRCRIKSVKLDKVSATLDNPGPSLLNINQVWPIATTIDRT